MSPQYLGSQWCRQEREWWIEAQRTLGFAHSNRIAIARIWPTGDAGWPDDLLDKAGHQQVGQTFYDKARADLRPQPFSWPAVDSKPGLFRDALLDFVGRIRIRLLEFKREQEQRRARAADRQRLTAPAGQVLYLYGRDSHAAHWERVNRELEHDGYTVFPTEPEVVETDPKKIRSAQAERIRIMSASDAVLVLGTDDSTALTADLMVVGRLDRHQAVAQSSRSLPCGVVDTVGIVRQNPDWSRKARTLGVDWFDASVSPWTPQLQSWLNGAGR
jgi:hypothetical protein